MVLILKCFKGITSLRKLTFNKDSPVFVFRDIREKHPRKQEQPLQRP